MGKNIYNLVILKLKNTNFTNIKALFPISNTVITKVLKTKVSNKVPFSKKWLYILYWLQRQ